jgi:hypothetical protein
MTWLNTYGTICWTEMGVGSVLTWQFLNGGWDLNAVFRVVRSYVVWFKIPLALPLAGRWSGNTKEWSLLHRSTLTWAPVRNRRRYFCNSESSEIRDLRIVRAVVIKEGRSWPLPNTPSRSETMKNHDYTPKFLLGLDCAICTARSWVALTYGIKVGVVWSSPRWITNECLVRSKCGSDFF